MAVWPPTSQGRWLIYEPIANGRMTGKKKPGNPHLRGPSGFSKPPNMVGRVGFEPTTNWLKANCSTN